MGQLALYPFSVMGSASRARYPRAMRREYHFWVYILASRSRNLYVGMTNSLEKRVHQHRMHLPGTHTAAYNIHRLVYFEYFRYVRNAIARETELKSWTRTQKLALIDKVNPTWEDLMTASVALRGIASPAISTRAE